jgi:phosphoenolpyruvate carboxykinase (GTP)
MLIPPEKYQRAGLEDHDGRRRHRLDVGRSEQTGRLRAINPEAGYFGVVPGTNRDQPQRDARMSHDTIFTNVALLPDGDVWWEGKTAEPPAECIDWRASPGRPRSAETGEKAAHPNSRFTAP